MAKFIEAPGQGDDRRRDPGDLRRPLRRDRRAAPGLAHATTSTRAGSRSSTPARRRTRSRSRGTCVADSENKVVKERLRDVDDELEIVIVKDMMLTGYDSPPLHTLYLDRPLKGALLMQTLARVNRTFRGKEDGLLVAYAPLADNLNAALAEYTGTDQEKRPVGRNIDEAVALAEKLLDELDALCAGLDWRAQPRAATRSAWLKAALGAHQLPARAPRPRATRWTRARSTLADAVPAAHRPARAGLGTVLRERDARRTCGPSCSSTKRSASRWPSSTPRSARRAASRSPRRSSGCSVALVADVDRSRARSSTSTPRPGCRSRASSDLEPRVRSRRRRTRDEPAPGDRGAAGMLIDGVGRSHPAQPGAAAGVLRAARGADEQVHQPAAHRRPR